MKIFCLILMGLILSCAPQRLSKLRGRRPTLLNTDTIDGGSNNSMFRPIVGIHCQNKTLCEHVMNYPAKYAHDTIEYLGPMHKVTRHIDRYGFVRMLSTNETVTVAVKPVCFSKTYLIYPKAIYSEDNGWLFVVNDPQKMQRVQVEKCRVNGNCVTRVSEKREHMYACIQNYASAQIPVIDRTGRPVIHTFSVGSGCSCSNVPIIKYHSLVNENGIRTLKTITKVMEPFEPVD